MFRKNYTDNDIIQAVKESKSIAQVLKKLGLKTAGGNYFSIKRKISILNIDTSHFTGMAWNKNERLKDWSNYKRSNNLKKHLIKERGHKCEECKLTEWLNKPIPLEIHHNDGDNTNNDIKNLKLLCCNCHSQTENWRKNTYLKNMDG